MLGQQNVHIEIIERWHPKHTTRVQSSAPVYFAEFLPLASLRIQSIHRSRHGPSIQASRAEVAEEGGFFSMEIWWKPSRFTSHASVPYSKTGRLHAVLFQIYSCPIRSYNILCGSIKKFAHELTLMPPTDPVRETLSTQLLDKLFNMGIISQKGALSQCDAVTVSIFCR